MDLFTIIGWIISPTMAFLGGILLKVKFSSPVEKSTIETNTVANWNKLFNAQSARIDDLEKELNEREKNHVKEIAQLKSKLGIVNEKVKSLQICREKYINCKTVKNKAFNWIIDTLRIGERENFNNKLGIMDSELRQEIEKYQEKKE